MKTQLIYERNYHKAATIIKEGGLVGFRTETVYGLGADATNADAVGKIFTAKGRPSDNPLIVHFYSIGHLEQYFTLDTQTKLILSSIKKSLTIILPFPNDSKISRAVLGTESRSIAVRIPSCKFTRKFIQSANTPIAAPSANTSTRPSPTRWQDVYADLDGKINAVIMGRQTQIGLESTVIKVIEGEIKILRHGGITPEYISKKTGLNVTYADNIQVLKESPGTRHKHYAPSVPLFTSDCHTKTLSYIKDKNAVILCRNQNKNLYFNAKVITLGNDGKCVGKNLYKALRESEKVAEVAIIESMPQTSEFATINERIRKASQGNCI
ncbi:MAG: L-threonylcarbamoyladenylate synthase [Firmicutes bacterium]|nr:L-threonylcarbamoyladenylate synthase [Bacillota bacterium]